MSPGADKSLRHVHARWVSTAKCTTDMLRGIMADISYRTSEGCRLSMARFVLGIVAAFLFEVFVYSVLLGLNFLGLATWASQSRRRSGESLDTIGWQRRVGWVVAVGSGLALLIIGGVVLTDLR
jgi:hypothetical protein